MRIHTNISSLNAQSKLNRSQQGLGSAIERLATGLRVNYAKDDAAGLAITNRMTSRMRGDEMAQRNTRDGISLLQTAEGAVSSVNEILLRMRELAVQRATETNTGLDRASIDAELEQLKEEINRIGLETSFGGITLTQAQKSLSLQVGSQAADSLDIKLQPISVINLGLNEGAIPLGPPLTHITVESGEYAGTWPVTLQKVITEDGTNLYPGDAESYFGVPVGSITLHQVLDLDGNPIPKKYVVRMGDKNYVRNESMMEYDPVTGTATYRIHNHFRRGTVYDPDNGITETNVFFGNAEMGWTTDGTLVEYLTHQGHYIAGKTSGSIKENNDFYLSGPNKNTIELMKPNLIAQIDLAIDQIDSYRTYLGATLNRLESVVSVIQGEALALEAAKSRIEDADYALEISNMAKNQILQQASQAVLAQSNQIPHGVLSLLKM